MTTATRTERTPADRAAQIARIRANANPTNLARVYGCTVESARQQYRDNAKQLRSMEAKARATGRRVNGYTAEQLATAAADFETRAEM